MLIMNLSGRNLIITWDSMQERKLLDKLRDRRPIYKIDEEGDSILHHYEFPKNSIRDILEVCGDNIIFKDKAAQFASSFLIETKPIEELKPIEGDLGIIGTPKPFQEKFLRINKAKTGMILSISTGGGKSLASIWRASILEGNNDIRLLVICPKRLLISGDWQKEIWAALGVEALRFYGHNKVKRQKLLEAIGNYKVVVTSYDQVAFLEGFEFDHLIIDEGHLIRGDNTKRYKNVAKQVKKNPRSVTVTTATPKPNKLSGLWALLKLVAPNLAGSKKSFLKRFQKPTRFMNIEKILPSGQVTTFRIAVDFEEINHGELNKFISPVVYTVPKHEIINFEDCLEFRDIEMLPKQRKHYQAMAAELLEKKKNRELEDGEILQYLLRLRQISEGLHTIADFNSQESNKLDFACQTIEDLDEGEKIIFWSCFQAGVNWLHNKYKDRAVLFNGSVSPAQIELGIKSFNGVTTPEEYKRFEELRNKQRNWPHEAGSAQIFCGTLSEYGSIGINLQNACSRQVVLSQADLLDTDLQACARISRLGQKADFVLTEYLFSKGTSDRLRMADKLDKKSLQTTVFYGCKSESKSIIDLLVEEVRQSL